MGITAIGNERTMRLSGVLAKVGAKAAYTYDFDDGWEDNLSVEKVLRPKPGLKYPFCGR